MWTRGTVASGGSEKIRLLLRSSFLVRYLHIRESSIQASLGSLLHCPQDSVESHAPDQVVRRENGRDSEDGQGFASGIRTSSRRESIFPSSSGSNFHSLKFGHFPANSNAKEHCNECASVRRFGSVPYSGVEDEASPNETLDGEHAASSDAGVSETWHTKLSSILATDPLSANQEPTAAPARIVTAIHEQDRRSSGDMRTDLRSRPTPFSVCQRLRAEKDIEAAWRYFTSVEKQEGYMHGENTYNTMLQSLCGAKWFSTVFALLETMRVRGFYLNPSTCVKILKSLANEQMFERAIALFQQVEIYGCKLNVKVYNAYLDLLVKAGHYTLVEAAFTTMVERSVSPDVYTYNIVLNGFRKGDQLDKALWLYEEMKQKGCNPNVVTYNTILHALGKAGRGDEVLELFCEMVRKDLVPSAFTYSTLLHIFRENTKSKSRVDKTRNRPTETSNQITSIGGHDHRNLVWTLCKEKDFASALTSLREMVSQGHVISLAIYNLFAVFLGDAGKTHAVLELFREMKARGCVPDALTYRTAVEAACRAQKAEQALSLYKEMVGEGHAVVVGTWNMLIDVASKAGSAETAFELFAEMQKTCKPDNFTYNILIFTLCNLENGKDARTCLKKAGIGANTTISGEQGALEIFRLMKTITAPDAVTYHTLVHAMCRSGQVQDCQELLQEMEESGIEPGIVLYNRVLNLLGQAGKLDKAWKLFLKMQRCNLPDSITYATVIKFLAKAGSFGKATKLLQEMEREGFTPSTTIYTTLIDALAKAKRFVEADNLTKLMDKRGCEIDRNAYNSLVDTYCKVGKVSKAYRIFLESIDKGCLPDTHTYTSLIKGYFKCGNTNDALDMYNVMKEMGSKPNGDTFYALLEGLGKAGRIHELEEILEEISQLGVASAGVSAKCLDRAFSRTRRGRENVEVSR